MSSQIKILLADDQPIVRAGLKGLLQLEEDFEIVGEVENIGDVKDKLSSLSSVDVLLLDLKWHENSRAGIEVVEEIRSQPSSYPSLRIIVVSNYSDLLSHAEIAGADIALSKNFSGDHLADVIRDAVNNPGRLPRFNVASRTEILTAKEKDILQLIQRGLSDKLIAKELKIVEQTVKNHNKNIFDKLNVTNRQEAVTRGLLLGIIELEDTLTLS